MNIILRGKPLRVRFEDDPCLNGDPVDGMVDHQMTESPCLVLRRGLCLLDLVDTLLHEMGHFYFPDCSEEVIHLFGYEFARTLLQMDLLNDPRKEDEAQTFLQ